MINTKRFLFGWFGFLLVIFVPFALGEVVTRTLLGKRLIFDIIEQDSFYRFEPNQQGWYLHNIRAPARINNIGARGEDVDLKFFPHTQKYFFFGDSFTFGYALQDQETIPHYFMQEGGLSSTQVVNYGNSAFSVYHMIRAYGHYRQWTHPGDTIVMIMIEDDFFRPLEDYQKTKLKDLLWTLRRHSSFVAWGVTAVQQVLGEGFSGFLNRLKGDNRVAHAKIAYSRPKDIFKEDGSLLLEFNEQVQKNGQRLLLVFYEYEQSRYSKTAKQFCQENGLTCVTDVYRWLEPLRKGGSPLVCDYDHHHPSAQVNQAVANLLWAFFKNWHR